LKIEVTYSCELYGLKDLTCKVRARRREDVVTWMKSIGHPLSRDHDRRSPYCRPLKLTDVKIPLRGDKIGGPAIH